ncbi:molybdopterin oxidoreductase family protein, partial [Vibrio natriegens]
ARQRGAMLVVIDPRVTRLAKVADIHLQLKPGSNIALINAMLHVIIEQKLCDISFIHQRCEGFEGLAASVETITPESVENSTGVRARQIRAVAELYGQAKTAMILYGMG